MAFSPDVFGTFLGRALGRTFFFCVLPVMRTQKCTGVGGASGAFARSAWPRRNLPQLTCRYQGDKQCIASFAFCRKSFATCESLCCSGIISNRWFQMHTSTTLQSVRGERGAFGLCDKLCFHIYSTITFSECEQLTAATCVPTRTVEENGLW